jgi:hypothetical protein
MGVVVRAGIDLHRRVSDVDVVDPSQADTPLLA